MSQSAERCRRIHILRLQAGSSCFIISTVAFERRIVETAMRRRTFLRAAGAATLLAQRVPAAGKQYFVYWGTYTTSLPRFANGESKGIYVSRLNSETGKLSTPELAAETKSPSYLAVHPSSRFLYAVNELGADDSETATGYMTAFSIDPKTGKLKELNRSSTKGVMPCHLNLDKTGAMAAAANWSSGSTVSIPVRKDGTLGEVATLYQHSGERSGVPPGGPRVEVHCHSVNFTPDNRFLIATDTGLNKVFIHRIDAAKGTFIAHDPPFLGLQHQANPRQFRFHPNGKWAYISNESGPGCTMLRYDARRGALRRGPHRADGAGELSRADDLRGGRGASLRRVCVRIQSRPQFDRRDEYRPVHRRALTDRGVPLGRQQPAELQYRPHRRISVRDAATVERHCSAADRSPDRQIIEICRSGDRSAAGQWRSIVAASRTDIRRWGRY